MKPDTIDAELKHMAEQWDVPVFDPAVIAQRSYSRARRRRRIGLVLAAIAVAVAGIATAASLIATDARNSPATGTANFARPAMLPPVRVTGLDRTSHPVTRHYVGLIVHALRGVPVTVQAQLTFPAGQRVRVRVLQAALIVVKPGTQPGVGGGSGPDAYYDSTEIAKGAFISADSPQPRILTVTTPDDLAPGRYPVLYVVQARRLGGQGQGFDESTYTESGGVGAIVITDK